MSKSKVRLSQCMIVKNEEKNIEQALSWGKDIMYEQIVVDTGSTDRTVEIAESMGARVVHFQWCDDFSAAKNFAIEQARGNWIALLDADEYFRPEDVPKLWAKLKKIENNDKAHIADFLRTAWVHLKEDGSVMAVSCQERIFRNRQGLRYRYRIHEELHDDKKKNLGCYDAQDELSIMHTGYGKQTDQNAKGERNAVMLEKDLEDNPKNASRLMYLGDAYCSMRTRWDDGLACYRRVLWEKGLENREGAVVVRAALQLLELQQHDPPEKTEEEYFRISALLQEEGLDDHPDLDYFLGLWYIKKTENEKAAEHFEKALAKAERYFGIDVVRMTARLDLPNWVVALVALAKGELQKAVKFSVAALQANKYCPEALQILMKAFQTEHRPGTSAEAYVQFICRLYDTGNLKDLLFIYRMAQNLGFVELAELAGQLLPPEAR